MTKAGHLAAACVVIGVGLVWRLAPLGLPPFWFKYGGGVLWGAMVLLIVGGLRHGSKLQWTTPLYALAIAITAELIRLFHEPHFDAFRHTLAGALLFGRVFNVRNIVAYAVDIVAALPLHAGLLRSRSQPRHFPKPLK
jgi:hypothetical protein